MPNTLKLYRNGAVGFIDWLDGGRCYMLLVSKKGNEAENHQNEE